MKKIAILFCLLLSGCEVHHIPRTTYSFTVDFTKYSNQGFLFTPDGYSGKFKMISQFNFSVFPAAYVLSGSDEPKKGYYRLDDYNNYAVEKLGPEYVIDSIYILAKNMGADCIMNLSIHPIQKKSYPKLNGFEVSGFAVKRE